MPSFPLREGAYKYRPLKRGLAGWDVFALQKCLLAVGQALPRFGADGHFGDETDKAVRAYQRSTGLTADGIAGVLTQRQAVWELAARWQAEHELPVGGMQGQIEAESSYWVGNYTAPYALSVTRKALRDMGVVMEQVPKGSGGGPPSNADHVFAFDAPARIADLGRKVRAKFDEYYGQPGAPTHRRAWELAHGSHNAPDWTDRLAFEGRPLTPAQTAHIEGYIQRVCVYIHDWAP